ncbi:hypothetical protein F383_20141 [Gossypium arboreum]|uniref:Uncharacterized protein n=1 Tax=Gossypium arboreum TaxID=29729 RepID=A0A0B0NU73_GOSAR|nr:hypothetical protein F383_20141 [Gossypium arboreum]
MVKVKKGIISYFCIRVSQKLARVRDRRRFYHTIQLLKGINDFRHFMSMACIGS